MRARKEIGPVCVQDGAVVFDFEEEVFNHAASEIDAVIFDETENDEVAVPAVHFVKATTRHDVTVWQIKQALVRDFSNTHIAHARDLAGQVLYFNLALLLHGRDGCWNGHTRR